MPPWPMLRPAVRQATLGRALNHQRRRQRLLRGARVLVRRLDGRRLHHELQLAHGLAALPVLRRLPHVKHKRDQVGSGLSFAPLRW